MPKFSYVALDTRGKEITGVLESDNTTSAVSRIREMGYFPTNVAEADKAPAKKGAKAPPSAKGGGKAGAKKLGGINLNFSTGKVKNKLLTAFTRQLATLIDAGLPLLRGLDVLRKGEKNPTLKRTLQQIAESVEAGSTFSEALAQHPKVFNRLYVNMVRAGEAGGVLDVTLSRLADFQEKAQKIKNKVIAAMVYPAVVIFVALAIVSFLMIVIVPKFQEIFNDLLEGKPLPALTQFVMKVSQLVQHQFLLVAGLRRRRGDLDQDDRQNGEGAVLHRQVQVACSCLRTIGPQGGHRPFHPYAGHAHRQRRTDPAGAQYCSRNRGQCRDREGRLPDS